MWEDINLNATWVKISLFQDHWCQVIIDDSKLGTQSFSLRWS